MMNDLRELWRFRELLSTMVKRELRVRYKNSFFGVLWSFINPLMMMVVTWVVFVHFLGLKVPNYTAYYLAAYLPFSFMQVAILDSAQSILNAQPVVKKVYFPRELLPLASVIGNFIHFLMGLLVLFIYLLAVFVANHSGEFPIRPTVIFLPVLLLITFCFTLGASLVVSALNTFYEDVKYMVTMILYMLYFLCPVMYFVENVANASVMRAPDHILWRIYNLNPIAAITIAFRKTILANVSVPDATRAHIVLMDWKYVGASAVISVVLLVYGYHLFNQYKWRFMERP